MKINMNIVKPFKLDEQLWNVNLSRITDNLVEIVQNGVKVGFGLILVKDQVNPDLEKLFVIQL